MNQAIAQKRHQWQPFQGIGLTSDRIRMRMVETLVENGTISNALVAEVMRTVPRHLFIDEALHSRAYEDISLPIGFSQTISQPSTVATMTQWLLSDKSYLSKVLEIGTGSGYQCAVLALLSEQVYSVERISWLHNRSNAVLKGLGLDNVQTFLGDGFDGLLAHGPFDAIISAASPDQLPVNLLEQLSENGRLIMPIGQANKQKLHGFIKTAQGIEENILGGAAFVPMLPGVQF